MPQSNAIQVPGRPTVEDVMVALAKQGIFDLEALARSTIAPVQEDAEAEDSRTVFDAVIYDGYVYCGRKTA